jgi:hypothetical protein
MRKNVEIGPLTYNSAIGFDIARSSHTVNVLYIKNNSPLKGQLKKLKKQIKSRAENDCVEYT